MNSIIIANALRFFGLVILQVLILKRVTLGSTDGFNYVQILLYPLFLMLLPFRTPRWMGVLLGFSIGFLVDIFYGSLGVHAAAGTFTGFIRPFVLDILAPKAGYVVSASPTMHKLGTNWFLRYSALMTFLHLFFYYSVDAFTFVYIADILLKTIFSFIFTMVFVVIYQYLLDPQE